MKKIFELIVIFILMMSFTGCGSDKNDISDDFENKSSSNGKKVTESSTKREVTPLKGVDENISVDKSEMDKLLSVASHCKWTEDDVRQAVKILKSCGVDFSQIFNDRFDQIKPNGDPYYKIPLEPKGNQLVSERVYISFSSSENEDKKVINEIFVPMHAYMDDECLYLYNSYLGVMKNCDDLFMPVSVYKKIIGNIEDFVESKGGKVKFDRETWSLAGSLIRGRHIEPGTKNIYYEFTYNVDDRNHDFGFVVGLPSKIYGRDFEDADFYGKFDKNGDVINMEIKRREVKNN